GPAASLTVVDAVGRAVSNAEANSARLLAGGGGGSSGSGGALGRLLIAGARMVEAVATPGTSSAAPSTSDGLRAMTKATPTALTSFAARSPSGTSNDSRFVGAVGAVPSAIAPRYWTIAASQLRIACPPSESGMVPAAARLVWTLNATPAGSPSCLSTSV